MFRMPRYLTLDIYAVEHIYFNRFTVLNKRGTAPPLWCLRKWVYHHPGDYSLQAIALVSVVFLATRN
ncbi:hypothetical protein HBA_0640 [Sodalis endosymbiont of Henestaris halophilus]|nr:hypothetical protein HBA_0640 [Sodalis endosymbiont of Henestaris halophilus]